MKVMNRKVDTILLEEAVRTATQVGVSQAAKQLGISRRTIRKALAEHNDPQYIQSQKKKRLSLNLKKEDALVKRLVRKTIEKGVEKASDELAVDIVKLTNLLYNTAFEALEQTRGIVKSLSDLMNESKKANPLAISKAMKDMASLVTVWDKAITSGQLLSNKPTSRNEEILKGNGLNNKLNEYAEVFRDFGRGTFCGSDAANGAGESLDKKFSNN